jgi:hypothetical protein
MNRSGGLSVPLSSLHTCESNRGVAIPIKDGYKKIHIKDIER